jgi:DNA-binding MurR/RpiR family transcriptional regulator
MNSSAEPLTFDIVARIAECAPELRSAERKVASLILDDLTGASRASIGALAQQAGVSAATVTRFAKAVGCRDVRELKLRLAQAAEPPVVVPGTLGPSGRRAARGAHDLRVRHGRRFNRACR